MVDDGEGQHLANREHELPAIAHDFTIALPHGFHDVGVAVGNIAPERHAQNEADDHQPNDVRHERLRQGEDDEHDHGREEHHAPADLVGQPAAE